MPPVCLRPPGRLHEARLTAIPDRVPSQSEGLAVDPTSPPPDPGLLGATRTRHWMYLAAFAGVMLMGLFLGLWVDMDGGAEAKTLDHRVNAWVVANRGFWPTVTTIARAATRLGNPAVATPAVFAIAATFFLLHRLGIGRVRRDEAPFWLLVAGAGTLVSNALKPWFQRDRPPLESRLVREMNYSFPSGHGIFSGVFFVLVAMLIIREPHHLPRWLRIALLAVTLLVSLSVAASRVWLGVHYLTDVTAGYLLGLSWGGAAVMIRLGWSFWPGRRAA